MKLIIGELKEIYELDIKNEKKIYFGYAGWSKTQLYGEFNKQNWGIGNISLDNIINDKSYEIIKKNKIFYVDDNIYSKND